jgi:tRNA threonylcarbamoyladenosine biosynthesis protein TsaE
MREVVVTQSETETQKQAAQLAGRLFSASSVFLQLTGELGAGKSAFARGFIREWLRLCGEPSPETLASPTYNLVKVYGAKRPLAHFDLYRLKSFEELEQLGYEAYFYETPCCLVEWLEQIPGGERLRPPNTIQIALEFGAKPTERQITIQSF